MMRIITGSARGTKLLTLEGDTTRPTAERTKEAIFSVLQFRIKGKRVLDLFAGSGQLGLEALSRGAEHAVFCDASRDALEIVRKNAEKTHLSDRCELRLNNAVSLLGEMAKRQGEKFHIVFLDPPYASGLVPECLDLIFSYGLLASDAVVVCETAREYDPLDVRTELSDKYEILKRSFYGAARVTLLKPCGDAAQNK